MHSESCETSFLEYSLSCEYLKCSGLIEWGFVSGVLFWFFFLLVGCKTTRSSLCKKKISTLHKFLQRLTFTSEDVMGFRNFLLSRICCFIFTLRRLTQSACCSLHLSQNFRSSIVLPKWRINFSSMTISIAKVNKITTSQLWQ